MKGRNNEQKGKNAFERGIVIAEEELKSNLLQDFVTKVKGNVLIQDD